MTDYKYLSVSEQEKILNKLYDVKVATPLREKFFLEYAEGLEVALLFGCSMVFWRAGFRGFNMHRYGKGRLSTLFLSSVSGMHGAFMHSIFVKATLYDIYRDDRPITYGIRSVLIHQFGCLGTLLFSVGCSFAIAHRSGIVPLPNQFLYGENRPLLYNYLSTKLRPYARPMIYAWLISSMLSFGLGLLEFRDSQNMLAKLNRSSLYLNQEQNSLPTNKSTKNSNASS